MYQCLLLLKMLIIRIIYQLLLYGCSDLLLHLGSCCLGEGNNQKMIDIKAGKDHADDALNKHSRLTRSGCC